MIKIYLLCILVCSICSTDLQAQTVKVSELGLETTPSKAIITALTSDNDTIIIDKMDMAWIVRPIELKAVKNKTVIIESGVEIIAKEKAFPKKSHALFKFIDCENIQIIGNGAKLCMNKDEYINGEWRHGISILGSIDISIENLSIQDTGGDGIYIAGSEKSTFSENIVLKSILSINNKRQGISIISGKNIQIYDSQFSKTFGTLPGAGIDIEPNRPEDTIENIFVSNSIFKDNFGAGIVISLGKLDASSTPVSIQFDNCTTQNNHSVDNSKAAAEIIVTANAIKPVTGELVFNNCTILDSNWGMLYSRKLFEAYSVSFVDCHVRNISGNGKSPIIYFEVTDYYKNLGSLGGFSFKNLYVEDINGPTFMTVRGSKIGTLTELKNVSANVISTTEFEEPVDYINYFSALNDEVNLNFTTK